MSDKLTIITNNVPRLIMDASELTLAEQKEFDYLDWAKLEAGEDSASFIRYKGQLYDLGDLEYSASTPKMFPDWDAYLSHSFFSGILFKFVGEPDFDYVVMGRYFA